MLDGIIKTKQKIIVADSGSVLHGMKKTDVGYNKFGEVYFSSVKKDVIKAWKLHTKMTLNLMVPTGEILFGFYDLRKNSPTLDKKYKVILSPKDNYYRLTVPHGIWFGFKGIAEGLNLVCNVSDIIHDPNEICRKELDEINFDWSN